MKLLNFFKPTMENTTNTHITQLPICPMYASFWQFKSILETCNPSDLIAIADTDTDYWQPIQELAQSQGMRILFFQNSSSLSSFLLTLARDYITINTNAPLNEKKEIILLLKR